MQTTLVLVRFNGKCYHLVNDPCRLVDSRYYNIDLSMAKRHSYVPCPMCYGKIDDAIPKYLAIPELLPFSCWRRFWMDRFAHFLNRETAKDLKLIAEEKDKE